MTRLDLYGAYYTISGTPASPIPEPRSNGIADPSPHGVVVRTGTHTGFIKLEIELHDREPPLELEDWDEVAEASLAAPEGRLYVRSFDEGIEPEPEVSPGPQRVRVHVRGRDTGHEADVVEEGEEVVEEHLLQF